MMTGSVRIEMYYVNGVEPTDDTPVMTVLPHEDNPELVVLQVAGGNYTVSIDELLRAVGACNLIGGG